MIKLEVCAADLDSIDAAVEGGAARVELCTGLAEGGMTPSEGLIRYAVSRPEIGTMVLIRPRPGDFLYSPNELEVMKQDIAMCRRLGAAGVVIGALTEDGEIDMEACRAMMGEVGVDMSVTFHRAFDLTADPERSLDRLIELGVDRVLTSGAAASAFEGRDMLRRLQERAAGRIVILAGGGVNSRNAAAIVGATGVTELHASARKTIGSSMRSRREGVSMGRPGEDEYSRMVSDSEEIRKIINYED